MEGINLATGNHRNDRSKHDFYPTPNDVTEALLNFLKLPTEFIVWEPCCGIGSMSEVIKSKGYSVISSDLIETGYGFNGIDFLEHNFECDAIITNPPFNISDLIIEHAMNLNVDTVAFLFKSQFWHAKKRLSLFNKYPPSYILPLTWRPDFMNGERGGSPTMEVLWTVWQKGNRDTRYIPLARPNILTKPLVSDTISKSKYGAK